MTDTTPADETAPQPHPAATRGPAAEQPPRPARRWWGRRVSLVIAGVAVLLGRLFGAGVTAIGAVAIAEFDDHHGAPGARHDRDRRNGPDGRGDRDGHDGRKGDRGGTTPAPATTTPAPTPSTTVSPAPSAS